MRAETSGKCDIKSDTPQRSRSSRINIDGGILLIGLNLLRRLIGNTDMVAQTTPFTENLGRHRDQQPVGVGETVPSQLVPPAADRSHGELGGVGRVSGPVRDSV